MHKMPNGILCVEPNFEEDQLDVTCELIDRLVEDTVSLIGKQPYLILFLYHDKYINMDKGVAKYIANHPEIVKYKVAEAITTHSLASKLVFNFYHSLMKPTAPAKLFRKKENAIKWLLKFHNQGVGDDAQAPKLEEV